MNKYLMPLIFLAMTGCSKEKATVAPAASATVEQGMAVIDARQKRLAESDKELQKMMSGEGKSVSSRPASPAAKN